MYTYLSRENLFVDLFILPCIMNLAYITEIDITCVLFGRKVVSSTPHRGRETNLSGDRLFY